jgi:hypothetical protein
MTYEDLCKSIGIDRDKIKKSGHPGKTPVVKEPAYLAPRGTPRVRRPPGEDLSHLVTPLARKIADKLKGKPRRPKK